MLDLAYKCPSYLLPTDILFQTSYWAEVKARQGIEPMAFDLGISGPKPEDVLVLLKSCGDHKVAFVPHGPEHAPPEDAYGPFLENFSLSLAEHLPPGVTVIRYDLPWKSPYADEMIERGENEYPEARLQELRMNIGTRHWNLRKTIDLTAPSTLVVDLVASETELLSRMKPKTRYNIGLAARKGVSVEIVDSGYLPDFFELYCQTSRRNKFKPCSVLHFNSMFQSLIDSRGESDLLFLLAMHEGDILAGAIIGISGRSAHFLYGASADLKRNHMAPYQMHWRAICLARDRGCIRYEMGAVPPGLNTDHRFHGLYRFKSGFGGRTELRTGSWDYPLNPDAYQDFANAEILSHGQ